MSEFPLSSSDGIINGDGMFSHDEDSKVILLEDAVKVIHTVIAQMRAKEAALRDMQAEYEE